MYIDLRSLTIPVNILVFYDYAIISAFVSRKMMSFSARLKIHSRSLNSLYTPSRSFKALPRSISLELVFTDFWILNISFLSGFWFEWSSIVKLHSPWFKNSKRHAKEVFGITCWKPYVFNYETDSKYCNRQTAVWKPIENWKVILRNKVRGTGRRSLSDPVFFAVTPESRLIDTQDAGSFMEWFRGCENSSDMLFFNLLEGSRVT